MTIETGNLEQAFADIEASYNVSPRATLSATDGIRHLALALSAKKNREASPEKRGTPDENQSLPRRMSQGFDLGSIMWEPSGTLGTQSDVGKFLECGFGAKTTPNLATTVAAPGTVQTTTTCDLTSVSGLAVGDIIIVTLAAGARREATRVKTIAGSTITYDALSAAPATGAVVVSGVNYKLASNLTQSLAIYKYYTAGGHEQAVYGCVVDKMTAKFDGTREVLLAISGPGAEYGDTTIASSVQAAPGAHTTVGAPAAGMTGNVYIDGTAFLVIAAEVMVDNQIELRNKELGTSVATGIAGRRAHRKITTKITFYLEDVNLITKANAVTKGVVRLVVGNANGSMLACVMPSVEFEIPDIGDTEGPMELTIEGIAYAVNGNDAVVWAEA